jgi:hypothetical protein
MSLYAAGGKHYFEGEKMFAPPPHARNPKKELPEGSSFFVAN